MVVAREAIIAERMTVVEEAIVIEPMTVDDWPAVAAILAAGISGADATFEDSTPTREGWMSTRIAGLCLVARASGRVVGWAALSPASVRPVYRGVGAVSIYVDPAMTRRGVGRTLLTELVAASERAGIWTVEAGIFPENTASIALHEACGFRLVGVRRAIGRMSDGRWRDVVLYERRSEVVGVEDPRE